MFLKLEKKLNKSVSIFSFYYPYCKVVICFLTFQNLNINIFGLLIHPMHKSVRSISLTASILSKQVGTMISLIETCKEDWWILAQS